MTPAPSVVLMGSKPGAVVALETMLSRGWDVRHVVVPLAPPPTFIPGPTLAEAAASAGVDVRTQGELPESTSVDFVISYMYRNRVKAPTLAMATRGAFNFHAAPLPEFGGWAFYNVAILEQASEYGVTCHHMDEGFDTGPLFRVRRFPIDAAIETAQSLEARAQREMIQLFVEFCVAAESGSPLVAEPQDPGRMRYLTREEFEALRRIPTDAGAETADRYARAFWYPPYDCAYTVVGDTRIEAVPRGVKEELGHMIHRSDLDELRRAIVEAS